MEATASSSSCLENSSLFSDRKRAIEELIKGQELTVQLRNHIKKSTKNDGSQQVTIITETEDLVSKILSSFTNSISILKNGGDSFEVSQVQKAHTQLSSPCCEAYPKPMDSGESIMTKYKTGRNKRRTCADQSWTQYSSTLIDDGHAWRKYGQKVIQDAKFLRNYFRCTYKYDQGCQATKQVQRIEEEPSMYKTTYYGHHTCKNLPKVSQLMLDSTASDQSPMISFGGTHNTDEDFNPFFSSLTSIQEPKDHDHQAPSDRRTQIIHNQSSPSDDYFVPPPAFESTDGHMTAGLSSDDHGDVVSGSGVNSSCIATATATASAHSLDMAVDFDYFLEFEF